ncbi:hypothetical protein BXZ70DRAFT_680630 [Cristinia sonorae]|uniref:Smr domain-containing protein n=1 Tax=Cristinia sonorae TaxID=1940300 RepID=A0A8K0UW67_9AGAR|nr:hypothetical protein BXZ70DRAFT_680630 [Cristinia sonorae]
MGSHSKLQDDLQAEFPPLDASLIAALVADHVSDSGRYPSPDVLVQLRSQLALLATQAELDENALSEHLSHLTFDNGQSVTDDSNSNDTSNADGHTIFTSPTSCNGSNSSSGSSTSSQAFDTPLGFLQAAFPDVPKRVLRSALGSMGDIDDIDMEAVVNAVLSKELIRDLEERGYEEPVDEDEDIWRVVEKKKTTPSRSVKKQKKTVMSVTLGDVRQQANIRPSSTPSTPRTNGASTDPWTQVSSMAAHLSSLLPSHPPAFFQSIFHSPKYATPSNALRGALASIATLQVPNSQEAVLYGLYELLFSSDEYMDLPEKDREARLADAELAFRATKFDPEATLSLLEVIQELDADSVSGEWGLFHSPVPSLSVVTNGGGGPKSPTIRQLPSGPPPVPPPPVRRQHTTPPEAKINVWSTVPTRKTASTPGYSHADFIPAYNTGKKAKMRAAGITKPVAGGRKGHSARASELMEERNQALREASRAWQRGNTKSRGGEVAMFYATKARELSQQAHDENLVAAREMIYQKRQVMPNCTVIDLHGVTVAEAVSVVQSILVEECPTEAKPLKVITGRGRHSVNGVGVLAPAVKAALLSDGWNVGTWDAGLIVRGKTGRRP